MKNVVKLLAVLFIALSFYGCKNNDDEFNASITEVFYTNQNPEGFSMSELDRVTNIRDKSHCPSYVLVVRFRQPNKDVVRMVMQYESDGETKESTYSITPQYVDQNSWWLDQWWTFSSPVNNKELKCYLEDASGRRSAPYTFHINLVQG